MLNRLFALGWARRVGGSRVIAFAPKGEEAFNALFGLSG